MWQLLRSNCIRASLHYLLPSVRAARTKTDLRNSGVQLDRFQPSLIAAVLGRDGQGNLVRKAGVLGIVRTCGEVRSGDPIRVELPLEPHRSIDQA